MTFGKNMKSPITVSAFVVPLLCLILGICYAFVTPLDSNDWIGAGFIVRVALALLVASLVSVILSVWAFNRKEKGAPRTLIFSIPGACFLLCLGIYFAENFTSRKKSKREGDVFRRTYTEIQDNPSLLRSKNWTNATAPEVRAFKNSLEFGTGPYTEEDIVYIYDTYPSFRIRAFRHPSCPERLLVKHFDEAWHLCESGQSYGMLAAICSNPNTPVELLKRVAESTTLVGGAKHPAQATLKKINGS
jgi:uncharacterized membrane protein YeaQ/YmgE (transglycosylase-associated protein family)